MAWFSARAGAEEPAASAPTKPRAPALSEQTELEAQIRALLTEEHVDSVRAPAEQAERALTLSRTRSKAHDPAGAARSFAIARAALALAQARAAWLRERALLASASRRTQEADEREKRAVAALVSARAGSPAPAAPKGNEQP